MSTMTVEEKAMLCLKALFANQNEVMVQMILALASVRPELDHLIRSIKSENDVDHTVLVMCEIVEILHQLAK